MARTWPQRSSRSKTSRLAIATAAATGWPAKVSPWANDSLPSMNGVATRSERDQPAHRHVGGGERLGDGDDVGLVVVALAAEPVAEPAPGADHLVGDQQYVVAVADLAHPLEVAVLRRDAAAGVLERLEDHRGDRVGVLVDDPLLDLVGRPERMPIGGPAVAVRVGHLAAARHQRLELVAQVGDPGGRQGAERGAVVGDLAGDELDLAGVAGRAVVGARELDRRLHRLRAARGEEDAVEVARRQRRDPGGELDRARVRVAPDREEVELLDLARRGLAELRAAMAGVDAEEGGEAVEVAVAVLVPDVGALAADDDRHVGSSYAPMPREVHPQVPLGELLEIRGGGRHGCAGRCHLDLPPVVPLVSNLYRRSVQR